MPFTKSTENEYVVADETGLIVPDSAGLIVVSVDSSVSSDDLANKKIVVQLEVTEASGGNGALDVAALGSLDGVNFTTLDASAGLAVDTTAIGNTGVGIIDLSAFFAPYFRFRVSTSGANDTLDPATVTLRFAYKLI